MDGLVTLGATLLSNETEAYASFAVLVNQAIARAVSPPLPTSPSLQMHSPAKQAGSTFAYGHGK